MAALTLSEQTFHESAVVSEASAHLATTPSFKETVKTRSGSPCFDALAMTRCLPHDILEALPRLLVNRQGTTPDAYMRTENFLGHVRADRSYRLTAEGFVEAPEATPEALPKPVEPPHVVLDGTWDQTVDLTIDDANILGGNGRYLLCQGQEELIIPVADCTAEHLAWYDSQLMAVGDVTRFRTSGNLPVTLTSVGKDYPANYLLDAQRGGGAYLEVHDRPHFHMPLDRDAGGYLILGKQDEKGIRRVSAFRIPFGFGVHMAPWAIHCDAYVVGRYLVIYSATPEFSTVIVRKSCGALAPVSFA
ncbi:hypothetical protein [Kiloniella sp. b19]|uniref:hypothetical protein n=1 Tax=Kiloniella sp. GXU_MW_B19 TaxID=3141326 RepID=UPI0031DCF8FD